jgi:hypothetical protein
MKRLILTTIGIAFILNTPLFAQQASQNIPVLPVIPNLEPGEEGYDPLWYLKGDGYLQRQVEPTIAVSTRNPDHLLSFFVDYRAVDVPDDIGLGEETQSFALAMKAAHLAFAGLISLPEVPLVEAPPIAAAEAWVGGSRSYDGGLTWSGFFMPGAPANFYDESGVAPSAQTQQLPIYGLDASTDPVAVAGPCGYVYVVFMAFTRGDESKMVVARFQDLNNIEGGDTWEFQGMSVIESGNNATNGYFLDKPSIALDIFRGDSDFSTFASSFSDYECGHRVYTSYSTFNGLESDGKFRSKINFAVSNDGGQTWDKSKIQQPYNQNQGSALAVDPTNGDVYLVWRHFFDPDAVLMVRTSNYGKKFSKPVDLTADTPMHPFDQPTISTTSVNPQTGLDSYPFSDLTFRSNAFPTAAVAADGNGGSTVFVAWQELVSLEAADFGFPSAMGSPRIVITRSGDGGNTWTGPGKDPADGDGFWDTRRAVDFADRDQPYDFDGTYHEDEAIPEPGFGALPDDRPSGPQVMPWLSVGGGKMALAYHESRGLLGGVPNTEVSGSDFDKRNVGIQPVGLSGWGYISGLDRAVDFRVALLDTVTGRAMSTAQVSRYPISADADISDGERLEDIAPVVPQLCEQFPNTVYCQPSLDFKNKPQSASGSAPFQGDYPGMTPVVPFFFDGSTWRWATSGEDVPFQAFHVVFADNRNLVPATYPSNVDEEYRYGNYHPDPPECWNVGSRNTDVLTAQVNAEITISAPTTYKSLENDVNSFPFTLRNGTASYRTFRLEIVEGQPWASFSYDIDGGVKTTAPDDDVVVYPYSSISQVVYIKKENDVLGPVKVKATDLATEETASITFNAGFANVDDYTGVEIDNPSVRNPFVRNPFVRNSSSTNVSLSNPFVRNPFVRNPFVRNTALEDVEVIDTTWEVEPEAGSTTASTYYPVININNAALFTENYAFQLIIWKKSGFGGANGCQAANISQDQILSNILPEPGEDPFVLNPSVSNPFVRNESPENPFVRNPFVRNPFVRNSAFTMAPADLEPNTAESKHAMAKFSTNPVGNDVTLPAPAASKGVNVTLRAHRLKKYCDETGVNLADCLQKPLCRPAEDPDYDLCVVGIVECGPDEDPVEDDCVIPNVFNPIKDPPSASVGSERCFMKIVTDPDSVLDYEERIALAEEECFKSPAPDLVPIVFETPNGSAEAGGTLPFPAGWQVYNQGHGPATAENRPLRSGFYLSTDNVLDFDDATGMLDQIKGDQLLIGVDSGDTGTTIGSGEYLAYADVVNIPMPLWDDLPPLPAGETAYHLILYVDDLLEVSEKNELNNFFSAVFDLEILVPNTPPEAQDLATSTNEDVAVAITLAATDVDDDPLTYSLVEGSGPTFGTLSGTPPDLSYQPDPDSVEDDSFQYLANDGEDDSNIATVTIMVQAVNDAPSFTKGPDQVIDEDAGPQTVGPWANDISPGPADESGQTVTFSVTNSNNALFSAQPSIDSIGTLTFTPALDQNGAATVTVTLSDDGLTSNGGVDTSEPQTFLITVNAVNDPPVAFPDTVTVDQNSGPNPLLSLLLNDIDIEEDPFTLLSVTQPEHGVTAIVDGFVTYAPNRNYVGGDSFSYSITDGGSGVSAAEVTVTVVDAVPDWGFVGLLSPWKSNYSMTLGSVLPMKWYYTEGGVYIDSSMANPRIDVYRLADCNGGPELFLAYSEDHGSGSDDWQGVSDWHYNLDTDRPAFDNGCYNIYVKSQYTGQINGEFRLRLK